MGGLRTRGEGKGRRTRMLWGLGLALAAQLGMRLIGRRRRNLTGQVALVTGGSRGLGLLLARELGQRGCRVAICARHLGELDRAQRYLEAHGAEVMAIRCDVTDQADVHEMVRQIGGRFGEIDILVNNAGVIQVGPVSSMTVEDFEQAMAVNFWGSVYTTLAVLPAMRARRRGRIANITSIGGKVATPHLLPYVTAKFAAVGFSEGLRAELGRDGISVTTVVPGLMRTGSFVHALFKGRLGSEFAWFRAGATSPLTAMDATRAARKIIGAVERREAEITIGLRARALQLAHDLFPGATSRALAGVNRLLPPPDGERRGVVPAQRMRTAVP